MNYLRVGLQKKTLKMKNNFLAVGLCIIGTAAFAQNETGLTLRQEWYHMSNPRGSVGVSTEEALEALSDREPNEIVIAIMDSGIDTTHDDLKSQLWINEDEIPGNGIDDDGNGYVDDIHGWNFIGGPNGNIDGETLEMTRLYVQYKKAWEGLDEDSIMKANPKYWQEVSTFMDEFESLRAESRLEELFLKRFEEQYYSKYNQVAQIIGDDFSNEQLDSLIETGHKISPTAKEIRSFREQGLDEELFEGYGAQLASANMYNFNTEWDIRDSIVGDDPNDWNDSIYGNTDIMGGSSDHGTHVAGIVGATRNNGIGINGIAPKVRIMVLRVVPDGDERDKDVGLAIKYAVRNGASIINMSFGKDYSPDAEKVQEIARWAAERDVLIVHAAGNDSRDLDYGDNFPWMPFEENNAENEAWIEVGASTLNPAEIAADFSNFGERSVDIFAPGDDIYSTLPINDYGFNSGTSMAAPVVTGVAGMIRSYYPELTAAQVKTILLESAIQPESRGFRGYCITNGIVNALSAVEFIESHKEELGL